MPSKTSDCLIYNKNNVIFLHNFEYLKVWFSIIFLWDVIIWSLFIDIPINKWLNGILNFCSTNIWTTKGWGLHNHTRYLIFIFCYKRFKTFNIIKFKSLVKSLISFGIPLSRLVDQWTSHRMKKRMIYTS